MEVQDVYKHSLNVIDALSVSATHPDGDWRKLRYYTFSTTTAAPKMFVKAKCCGNPKYGNM